ncbi:MAG TPA: DUF481 domain-containing protein [Kofleriaceae bacterium]|nr:DUF481 domain-containing protein [Kofleriaceae bacterium]
MRRALGLSIVLAFPALAHAGDPKFEYGKAEEVKDVKDVEWVATAEAGVVFTTGNSETTTATGGVKASRKTGKNKLALEASAAYAKSGARVLLDQNGNGMIDNASEIQDVQTITAETLASRLRYDRFLTELNSLFVAALASRDTPAGKELVLGAQAGYSRSLRKTATSLTLGEFGYDYSHEDLVTVDVPSVSIHSARAFIGHHATMTEGADLDASLEVLTNLNSENITTEDDNGNPYDGGPFQDTRVNAKISISAKIGQNLAFQSAIEVKYDRRPGPLPVKNLAMGFTPAADTLDTIMKASFIYTFVAPTKK